MTWLVITLFGTLVALVGVTVAVGAASANRLQLVQWVIGRRPGARAARTLLFAPTRIQRAAGAIVTAGALVAALGVWVVLAPLPTPLLVVVVLLLVVPIFLSVVYAGGRAAGRQWPQQIVRAWVPWVDRSGALFAPIRTPPAHASDGLASVGNLSREDVVDRLGTPELTAIAGALAFTERPVREVMTPRTNVTAVPSTATVEEIGRLVVQSGHERIPVFDGTLDNITGMLYAFDLVKVRAGEELPVRSVATAPASLPCGDLLFQMQRDRQQLAVVLDEYGGTAGIVTLDDLANGLVDGVFRSSVAGVTEGVAPAEVVEVSGTLPLADLAARFDVALACDAETVGGALARLAGRIPASGERFRLGGLEFDVLEASATRVQRVAVRHGPVPIINLEGRATP